MKCFTASGTLKERVGGNWNICWVGTTSKGFNWSCLASLTGVHLLFYIPVILLLIIMCIMYIFYVICICYQTSFITVSRTLNKLIWIELNCKSTARVLRRPILRNICTIISVVGNKTKRVNKLNSETPSFFREERYYNLIKPPPPPLYTKLYKRQLYYIIV